MICLSKHLVLIAVSFGGSLNEVDTFTTPTHSKRIFSELSIDNHVKLANNQLKSAVNFVEFEAQDLGITGSVFSFTESMKILPAFYCITADKFDYFNGLLTV